MYRKGAKESNQIGTGLKYKSYEERLALLQTTSLESRRIRGDLIQVFQIMNGFDDVNKDDYFELDTGGGYSLRGHHMKLKVHRSRLQRRQCFFSQRVVSLWKKLPASVVEASSVNMFKKRLDDRIFDVGI